jgi:hypothetical protein
MNAPFFSVQIEKEAEEMADAPDERDDPGLGLRDYEAAEKGAREQAMETDLIDFEEEPGEHPDEALLDGDSEDESAPGHGINTNQDKSAGKDNKDYPSTEKFLQSSTEIERKDGDNDGIVHASVGKKTGKCHKEPPSAPAPWDSKNDRENVGGGGWCKRQGGCIGLPGAVPHHSGCQAESRQHRYTGRCWRLCTECRPAPGSGHGIPYWRRR